MSTLSINVKVDARLLKCQQIIVENCLTHEKKHFTVVSQFLFSDKDKNTGNVYVLCFNNSFADAVQHFQDVGYNIADTMSMVPLNKITELDGFDEYYVGSCIEFNNAEVNGMKISDSIDYDDYMGIEQAIWEFAERYDIYDEDILEEWTCSDENIEVPDADVCIDSIHADILKQAHDKNMASMFETPDIDENDSVEEADESYPDIDKVCEVLDRIALEEAYNGSFKN